jgi:hypothetical protein
MKPVRLDFIEDRRWRLVWSAALVCALALAGNLIWRLVPIYEAQGEEQALIAAAQLQLQNKPTSVQGEANPRFASLSQAAQLLQQDLNPAFASAENLQEPGVRLRSLTLEAGEGSLRLEYDLESMVKASAITDLLNTGYEQRPWQLESVSGSADSGTVGGMPMTPTTSGFRGVWTVQLKKL